MIIYLGHSCIYNNSRLYVILWTPCNYNVSHLYITFMTPCIYNNSRMYVLFRTPCISKNSHLCRISQPRQLLQLCQQRPYQPRGWGYSSSCQIHGIRPSQSAQLAHRTTVKQGILFKLYTHYSQEMCRIISLCPGDQICLIPNVERQIFYLQSHSSTSMLQVLIV